MQKNNFGNNTVLSKNINIFRFNDNLSKVFYIKMKCCKTYVKIYYNRILNNTRTKILSIIHAIYIK